MVSKNDKEFNKIAGKGEIHGWKKTNEDPGERAQWVGVGHEGLVDIRPTGEKGVLTSPGYQTVVGYGLSIYPDKGGQTTIVNETFAPLKKDAIKWMKAHPNG